MDSSAQPGGRALSLAAVMVSTVGVGVSYGIGYPITALGFERWGAPDWLTGLAGSAPALGVLLCLPFFPALVARIGMVAAMALGCAIVAGGFVLMPLLASPHAWLLIRFAMGAGLALPWLVGETWINTVTTDATRGRMLALYSIALFSGFAAGPLVLEATGISGWRPFAIGAGGILLAVLPILAARSLAPAMAERGETGVFGAFWLAPAAMLGGAIGGLLEMGHFAMLPVYALQTGSPEHEALRLLSVFMIGGMALQPAIGWLADRASAYRVMFFSAFAFGVVVLALPLAPSGAPRLAAVFLIGGIAIGFYTLALAHIGQRVRPGELSVANAAFLMSYQVGALTGPGVAGAAMALWPPQGFVAAMVLAAALGAWALGAAAPTRRD
ncbi:MAG: MFS transporter [Lautropia sp.]